MIEQKECRSAWPTASPRCESWKETEPSGRWCPILSTTPPHLSAHSLQIVDVRQVLSSCVVPFFAICILQNLFESHSASTTEKISVINSKEGGVPYYQNNQMCRVHLTRLSLVRLGRT